MLVPSRGQTIEMPYKRICSHFFLISLSPKLLHSLVPGLCMFQRCDHISILWGLSGTQKAFPCIWKGTFLFFELMLVDFESCIRVGCTAFWFRSISTDILFLFFWAFLFLQGSVEDWLGPVYSRLGPGEDWCLHLWGCMSVETSWLKPVQLFGHQENWLGFPRLWVWFSLPMKLFCVSSEIPRTRDTAPSPSSSVGISSLYVRIPGSWSLAAADMISSYFTAEHPSVLCTYHIVFMHPSVDGYYGGLQTLATVNSAAMNVALQGSFSICWDIDPTCDFQVLW